MKRIRSNAEQVLREDYNKYSDKTQSIREWIKCSSESDPNFFSWLFEEELNAEFDNDLTDEDKEIFDNFLNSLQVSKEELIEFCSTQDYAFAGGAGIMYANDEETREGIVESLNASGIIIEEIGCEGAAKELKEEVENGCTIYKVWKYNEEPLYIAYYE